MTIYTGPVFEMARDQFHVIADYLDIPSDERERLLLSQTRQSPSPARFMPRMGGLPFIRATACSTISRSGPRRAAHATPPASISAKSRHWPSG